jgi:hypothetical protein
MTEIEYTLSLPIEEESDIHLDIESIMIEMIEFKKKRDLEPANRRKPLRGKDFYGQLTEYSRHFIFTKLVIGLVKYAIYYSLCLPDNDEYREFSNMIHGEEFNHSFISDMLINKLRVWELGYINEMYSPISAKTISIFEEYNNSKIVLK